MSTAKPLTASIAERLGLKPEPERRPAPKLGPPPSSKAPASKVHQLRPPEGPERSFVEVPEVAGKKKAERRVWPPEFRAKVAKEAMEAAASGATQVSVAKKHGISESLISQWVGIAKKKAQKKGSRRWARASPELKAEKVKKALELMAAGKTQQEAATLVDVGDSTLSYWIKEAKGENPRAGKAGKAGKAGDDVVSLSRELAAVMERAEAIKKKLRRLLGA